MRNQINRHWLQIEQMTVKNIPVETDILDIATAAIFTCTLCLSMHLAAFVFQQSRDTLRPAIPAAVGHQTDTGAPVKHKCRQEYDKQICHSLFHPAQRYSIPGFSSKPLILFRIFGKIIIGFFRKPAFDMVAGGR